MRIKTTLLLLILLTLSVSAQYKTLGSWNSQGVPDYLVTPGDNIDSGLMQRIENSLPESVELPDSHPEYILSSSQGNIVLQEEAEVWVTYIREGAGYLNVLGFYTYDNNNPPASADDIDSTMTIVFPNVSNSGSGGGLNAGDKVSIGTFEEGTAIGWFLLADGYKNGNVTDGHYRLFSNPDLNPESDSDLQKHNVLLRDQGTGKVVLGFEDIRRDYSNCDQDFNDALFYITANPIEAIDYDDIPDLDDPDLNSVAGRLWLDDEDGIEETGEEGIENVTVYLINESGLKVDSTTTDANGDYEFTAVGSGNYFIEFDLSDDYEFAAKDQGSDDAVDSDVNPGTSRTDTLHLSGNVDLTDVDAGVYVISNADLSITKTVSDDSPENENEITYTIKVTNNGPGSASGIEVKDDLPAGLLYLSHNASQGTYDTSNGVWNAGTLANGESAELAITVKVDLFSNTEIDLCEAEDFNLFVFEDLEQPSSDTEGKVAVGGNATLGNYSVGAMLNNSNGTEDVLVVGGYLNYTSGAVYGGNVVYGDSTNLPQSAVSITDGTLRQDNPIDFDHARECLENLSQSISVIGATDTTAFEYGELKLTGSNPFVNIFEVDGSQLSSANNFTINVPNGSVVLVNVSGTDISWTGGLTVNGTAINNVLYNFYEAEKLYIQGIDVRGTVLAPYAELNFPSGVINGQVIVKSMVPGSGQYNSGQNNAKFFSGNLPVSPQIINVASITNSDLDDPDHSNNSSSVEINVTGTTGGSGSVPDDDENWDYVGSFGVNEMIWSMTQDNAGNKLIGTVGGHIYRSADGGTTWTLLNGGTDMLVGWIWDLAVDANGTIYAATEQGLYTSTDNGATWTEPYPTTYDIRSIVIADNGTYYAATWGYGIIRKETGEDYEEINEGLTSLAIQSLAIDGNGNLYAGTFGNGIMKSEDGGDTWSRTDLSSDFIWSVAVNSVGDVYAGTYGNGVYKSADGGASWTAINDGLNSLFVYGVSVDDNDNVYISTWTNGVYMIEASQAASWSQVGLNGVNVSSIMFDSKDNNLYIGTSEGKVYKKTSSVTAVEDDEAVEVAYGLAQNYPNPFNPTTLIEYSVAEPGFYTINIYNVIGQKVETLVAEYQSAGKHTVNFNAGNLASGIYLYQLKGDNISIVKKMMLMK